MTDLNRLRDFTQKYVEASNGPQTEDHKDWCDYRQRKPAVGADCDCGVFGQWEHRANAAADVIAHALAEAVTDSRELDWDQRAGVWRADRCIRTH